MSTVSSLSSSTVSAQLQQVETRLQAPITSLKNQVTTEQADISAWGSINGAVSSLATALAGISDVSTLVSRAATSSETNIATATAASSAVAGTYALGSVQLAKTQEIYSAAQASAGAALTGGAGSLSITLNSGTAEHVTVGSGSLTLSGVAAAINRQAGGVKASVIGTSADARLVLTSSATGASGAFTVAGTGALAQFAYAPGSATSTEVLAQGARDATLTINGVPVTAKSNSLANTLKGVTVSLAGSGSTTVTVSSAPTAFSAAVSSVANNLNSAIATIAKEIKYVPASSASSASAAKSGPLLGNFTATDLQHQLLTAVSGAAASGLSANAIGLEVSSTGGISFDASTFATAYASNPGGVQALVKSVYGALNTITTAAIGAASASSANAAGVISAQTTALQDEITSLNSQVSRITSQNNAQLKILVQEYTVAENAANNAQVTQAYLDIFTGTSNSSS